MIRHRKSIFLASFLVITQLVQSIVAFADEVRAPLASADKRKLVVNADKDPIRNKIESGVWGTGMYYARPTKGFPQSGWAFKTNELHLVVGNFRDDNKYSGNTVDLSTKDLALARKIDGLNQEKHYIFKYWKALPLHFNMEKTSDMVTSVEESFVPSDFVTSGLPYELDVRGGRHGGYTNEAVANGRITDVIRWNTYILNRPICSFTLDSGGSRRTSKNPVANETIFNIYSEEGCKYIESIIPYGLELKVTYSIAYFAAGDFYDHIAHSVVVDMIPTVRESDAIVSANRVKSEALFNDPEFQAGLKKLVEEYWQKHYGAGQDKP